MEKKDEIGSQDIRVVLMPAVNSACATGDRKLPETKSQDFNFCLAIQRCLLCACHIKDCCCCLLFLVILIGIILLCTFMKYCQDEGISCLRYFNENKK